MQRGSSKAERSGAAPFLDTVGVLVTAVSAERARLELPYRDENANRNGSLHGGVVAALVDVAAATVATAGQAEIDPARRAGSSTIDFTVHYLAPAIREDVAAEAIVLRRGRDITFVEVAVTSAARPIARGMIAYRSGAGGATASQRERDDGVTPHPSVKISDVAVDRFVTRTSGSPFTRRLGVASVQLGRGHAVSLLPLRDAILAADGTVHEGAVAALVDCAGGAAAWSIDGFDPDGRAATIGMHLCFDVGTRGEDVAAEAITSWNSAGVYVNSVTVAGRDSGRAIASGSVTYRIVKRANRT